MYSNLVRHVFSNIVSFFLHSFLFPLREFPASHASLQFVYIGGHGGDEAAQVLVENSGRQRGAQESPAAVQGTLFVFTFLASFFRLFC